MSFWEKKWCRTRFKNITTQLFQRKKVAPKFWLLNLQKLPNESNPPIGEKSSNLVTLQTPYFFTENLLFVNYAFLQCACKFLSLTVSFNIDQKVNSVEITLIIFSPLSLFKQVGLVWTNEIVRWQVYRAGCTRDRISRNFWLTMIQCTRHRSNVHTQCLVTVENVACSNLF
jgi:hypothetical protein